LPEGPVADRSRAVLSPRDRALQHLLSLQRTDGAWEGEVVWCTMILSQYVIVCRAAGRRIEGGERRDIMRHYAATRTAEGGWGLHPEGPPQVFTTTLAYVALRLLESGPDDDLPRVAREWLHRQPGGVLGIPTWGKFWLSLLQLYGREGVGPLPPELFTLPDWIPFHPRRWYCHTRYIYLGMSYLSGRGFSVDLGPVKDALRSELYDVPYDTIDFAKHRGEVAASDLHAGPTLTGRILRGCVSGLSGLISTRRRQRTLDYCLDRIRYEQRATRYQGLSPVNGLLNCLALAAGGTADPDLGPSLDALAAWQWRDEAEGIRYAGARSQTWDTAFAARAVLAARRPDDPAAEPAARHGLERAHQYLVRAQMAEELERPEREHREPILGGWCFSDGRHRWPVSDCAAEALAAIVEIENVPGLIPRSERIDRGRIEDGVRFLVARQNADGGFGTYEPSRGAAWLEALNPSEMFRDCMTEHSYIECTASVVEALAIVRQRHPELLTPVISRALGKGIEFLRRSQRPDGTFPAAWGICFTYSIFHVTKALTAAGIARGDEVLVRAARWLKSAQRPDGGWGEHFSTCLTGRYAAHPRAQAVMTSWALLSLAAIEPDSEAVAAGRRALEAMEQPDGSWPPEAVNGVFFGTAMLHYRLYWSYFPVWALACR
jgi:squalene/oxidosqualene cyclase-like protein